MIGAGCGGWRSRRARRARPRGRGVAAAVSKLAPFLRLAVAQPEHRGPDMGRHVFTPAYRDRHFGTGRGEDPGAFPLIAGGAAIERLLDPRVRDPAALGDGGCEIGMAAAPFSQGRDVDLEETGDVARLGAETAELERLGSEQGVVGRRCRAGGGGRGSGAGWRKFPVIGRFYFFRAGLSGFTQFFGFGISGLQVNSLIIRNREFGGAEQGILLDGTGNSGLPVAGIDRGERSG